MYRFKITYWNGRTMNYNCSAKSDSDAFEQASMGLSPKDKVELIERPQGKAAEKLPTNIKEI